MKTHATVLPNGVIIDPPNCSVQRHDPFPGRVGVGPEPDVGQELRELVGRGGGRPAKHIYKVSRRIDPVTLAASRDAEQGRITPTRHVKRKEKSA